jgi:hypothetical protein
VDHLKLKKLKGVAYNALRDSLVWKGEYLIDPFGHYTPEVEIIIDLVTGRIYPERDGDSVEEYYSKIHEWFLEVLPKENISTDIIDSAVIKISPAGKKCIILAQGREFRANLKYK